MTATAPPGAHDVGIVTVRYWAAARSAAGVDVDLVPVSDNTTLADVLTEVRRLHEARPRLAEILAVCSILIGDQPVGAANPASVVVAVRRQRRGAASVRRRLTRGNLCLGEAYLPPRVGILDIERAVSAPGRLGAVPSSQGDRPGARYVSRGGRDVHASGQPRAARQPLRRLVAMSTNMLTKRRAVDNCRVRSALCRP